MSFYQENDNKDPQGMYSGDARVLRGGSWIDDPRYCRAANRVRVVPGTRDDICGCRLLLRLD